MLVERGATPGSKNMFGGMFPRSPVIEELVPRFWEEAPWERHVVKRTLTVLSDASAASVVFESAEFDHPPYNGCTLYRPIFDRWFAQAAQKAGVRPVARALAEELLVSGERVQGVRVNGKEIGSPLVIACDGVLSLTAKQIGLVPRALAADMALGVKALFRLSEEAINERFNLVRRQGASHEFLGCTEGVRGGGFIYTQTETLSAGLVCHLDSLKERGIAPYNLFERFVAQAPVAKLLKGARLVEYSAHLLPEGGYDAVPRLSMAGLLLAGDAAGLCYTNGLNQEGMNLAVTSGFLAGETAVEAFEKGDFSARQLSGYEARLKESFVLKDMKTFRRSADLMHEDRLFSVYPRLVGAVLEELYRSDGTPKKGFGRTVWDAARSADQPARLLLDALKGGRSLL